MTAQHYTSTACHHQRHDDCRKICKWCPEACRCACHTAAAKVSTRRCAYENGCDGIPLPFDLACDRHPACTECGGRIMHDIGCRTARTERRAAAGESGDTDG